MADPHGIVKNVCTGRAAWAGLAVGFASVPVCQAGGTEGAGRGLLAVSFREVARSLRQGSTNSDSLWIIVAALLALFLFWMVLFLIDRYGRGLISSKPGPAALLNDLVRQHHLSPAERRLLAEIAESRNAVDQLRLFIDPRSFGPAALRRPQDGDAVVRLQRKLFGSEELDAA